MSTDQAYNPAGTDGFEFLEFAAADPQFFDELFTNMGFTRVAKHKSKNVMLWLQGDIKFIVNAQPDSFASDFVAKHGPSVCGMAFRVFDGQHAFQHTTSKGGKPYTHQGSDWFDAALPVIYGIGDNLLYLFDQYDSLAYYEVDFDFDQAALAEARANPQLTLLDHVTHNVFRGNMNKWAGFYEDLFNFREIRYFDIEGKLTGLLSRAMTSPCCKVRIPINEATDDKSQIQEYLDEYNGEGIQHIAMATDDIYKTVETLRKMNLDFMSTPASYYRGVSKRLPYHTEPLERMEKNHILIDGAPTKDGGILLQIFTKTVIGPVFFEIIQRKGDEGFGEGNFQALFDSIEQDQIDRGYITLEPEENGAVS